MQLNFEGMMSGLYKPDAAKLDPTKRNSYLRFSLTGWLYTDVFSPASAQAVQYYGVPYWIPADDVEAQFEYYSQFIGVPVIAVIDLTLIRGKDTYQRWTERLLHLTANGDGWKTPKH